MFKSISIVLFGLGLVGTAIAESGQLGMSLHPAVGAAGVEYIKN